MCMAFDTTCMLKCAVQKKRSLPLRRIFSNHKNGSDREYLIAKINALIKTVDSNREIMQEQHEIINDLKKQLNILPEDHSRACPISEKIHTNLHCINSYIPEHNMHYGNKIHE